MMTRAVRNVAAVLAAWLVWAPASAEDWPQWRGPRADGISGERGLPVEWSAGRNILWRAPLAGLGTSTPIVWKDRIFITAQLGDGPFNGRAHDYPDGAPPRRMGPSDGVRFTVQAFSARDGAPLWEHAFAAEGHLEPVHLKHNLATPSCVTDGKLVYAWFGTGQLLALTLDGKLAWQRHLGKEYKPFEILWAHGSSPLLHGNSLYLLCDHAPASYLLSLDKRTGRELWKADRGAGLRSYTTPLAIPASGADQVVINSNARIDVYDSATGKLLWYAGDPVKVPVPTPVFHAGVLYANRGFSSSPYLAIKTGGGGDVNASHVLWHVKTGGPYVSSLVYYDGLIYMAQEGGIASCVDAADGALLWRQRLGGVFSASPVVIEGRIYLANEQGDTFVLASGREFKVLARNSLGERTLASPAVSGGTLFLRTDTHLIAVGSRAGAARAAVGR